MKLSLNFYLFIDDLITRAYQQLQQTRLKVAAKVSKLGHEVSGPTSRLLSSLFSWSHDLCSWLRFLTTLSAISFAEEERREWWRGDLGHIHDLSSGPMGLASYLIVLISRSEQTSIQRTNRGLEREQICFLRLAFSSLLPLSIPKTF